MADGKLRKGKEDGHRRKFMVIVDETPECESAVYFSACRARNTGSDLHMLFVVEPEDFQHWLSAARWSGHCGSPLIAQRRSCWCPRVIIV